MAKTWQATHEISYQGATILVAAISPSRVSPLQTCEEWDACEAAWALGTIGPRARWEIAYGVLTLDGETVTATARQIAPVGTPPPPKGRQCTGRRGCQCFQCRHDA